MATSARLISLQVGMPRDFGTPGAEDPADRPWRSGILKEPVSGPVQLMRTNLAGDGQAALGVHGGPDMAVLVYDAAHYARWREELPAIGWVPGSFGENFLVEGWSEKTACLGDVWQVGDEVRTQISQPRGPCLKLARRWNQPDLMDRVKQTGRTGWYLRVLQEGRVAAGQPIVLVDRPRPEWPIARVIAVCEARKQDPAAARALSEVPELSEAWRKRALS